MPRQNVSSNQQTTDARYCGPHRMLTLFLVIDVIEAAATGEWGGVEFWVFVLIAEYAATVRTIPPTELSKGGAAEASSGR